MSPTQAKRGVQFHTILLRSLSQTDAYRTPFIASS